VTDPDAKQRRALRSFVFGGVVGGLVAVAAPRARRRRPRETPVGVAGLEAFEGAPSWEYDRGLADAPASTHAVEPTI
jgi:hypothetical protein